MKSKRPKNRRARARRRLGVLIAVAAFAGLCLFAILLDAALYYGKVHSGVTVAGQAVGGMTRDEVTQTITRFVQDARDRPITLVSGNRTWSVLPSDLGAEVDVDEAVAAAMDVTRGNNLVVDLYRRLSLYFEDRDVPLTGTIDQARLEALAAAVAEDLDVPPVNAGLVFEGTRIRVVEGQKGRIVDQQQLRALVRAAVFALRPAELAVPLVTAEPAVKAEDGRQAVVQAETMIASRLTLKHGEKTWRLTGEQIAAYMDFASEMSEGVAVLVPYLSAKKMKPFLDEVALEVDKKPVNASFKSDGERAWVVEAVAGRTLQRDQTAEALTEASLKTGGRVAEVVMKTTEPDFTTQEAEAMGITDRLGGYTTRADGSEGRRANVRITTEYAGNVVLAPGEVYDFDKQIGPRTAERGYMMAPGIVRGELEDQLGGGICQVATTLFNAAFEAGLEIIERRNHSLYIEHYPTGRDAAVSAGGPNLRFRNDMSHHILIRGTSNGITTTFTIYGTDEGRTVESETGDFYDIKEMTTITYPYSKLGTGTTEVLINGQTGKKVKVTRTVRDAGGRVIHEDTFVSIWRMIPREIRVGTAVPSTTTTTAGQPDTTTTTERRAGPTSAPG